MIALDEYAGLNEQQREQVKRFVANLKEQEQRPFESCPFYERCESQICPMDPSKAERTWYTDEGPCLNPDYRNEQSIINQKKLTKKQASGYFTFEMLNRDIIIRKGIQGIDPDVPESVDRRGQSAVDSYYREKELSWLSDHPQLTEEQREKMKLKAAKGIEALNRYREGDPK